MMYTAIVGNKDHKRTDIPCFGDYNQFTRPVMNAKIYKVLAHKFVEDDISIWIDGNIELLIPEDEFIKDFLGDADIAVFKHFDRDCLYNEAPAAKGLGGDYVQMIDEQVEHYRMKGFPGHAGLPDCSVIVRRHNKETERFNESWWAEICRWSCRDQISFPYVLRNFPNLKVKFNVGNPRDHINFKYTPHTHIG